MDKILTGMGIGIALVTVCLMFLVAVVVLLAPLIVSALLFWHGHYVAGAGATAFAVPWFMSLGHLLALDGDE